MCGGCLIWQAVQSLLQHVLRHSIGLRPGNGESDGGKPHPRQFAWPPVDIVPGGALPSSP